MLMATVLKLVPAVAAAVLSSLVHTAVLVLLSRESATAAGVPRSGSTHLESPGGCRLGRAGARGRKSARGGGRGRRGQTDFARLRRRAVRVGWASAARSPSAKRSSQNAMISRLMRDRSGLSRKPRLTRT
jgi:hypothetical protein